MTVMLTAPVDDAGELTLRAQSLLREAGWFVRCEGEADVARLQRRAARRHGGPDRRHRSLHSGKYYVWSVRHTITADSHKMKFVLVRNAVGALPSGGGLPGEVYSDANERTGHTGHARAPSQPLLRQVSRHGDRRRREHAAHQGQGARRARRSGTGWCMPCVPYAGDNVGFAFLPEQGAASGSNSKAATSPIRSGPAATGGTVKFLPMRRPQ